MILTLSDDNSNSLSELGKLFEERLAIVGMLAESLEASRWALGRKEFEAIARGAAHQAQLCRQWSELEAQMRTKSRVAKFQSSGDRSHSERSDQVAAQWEALSTRLRYLTRVHWSLLRHMQRSLGVLNHMIDRCAPTYGASIVGGGSGPTLTQPNVSQRSVIQPNPGAGD